MQPNQSQIAVYLSEYCGCSIELLAVAPLGGFAASTGSAAVETRLKAYGYGKPLLLRYRLVRRALFAFVENVLHERVFDPCLVTAYLKE